MKRIDFNISKGTSVTEKPQRPATGTPGYFTLTGANGPTIIASNWLNTIQDELKGILDKYGVEEDGQDDGQIADILVLLGFEITRSDSVQLMVMPPSHRVDVEGEHDLIEEVARVYGYDNIESSLPNLQATPYSEGKAVAAADDVRDALCSLGFREAVNYSFISPGEIERFGLPLDSAITILNPISQDQSTMRPSLMPGMLRSEFCT